MIKLPYARNTISNVIMVRNMGQNKKKLSEEGRKKKIEELTKSIRSQQASLKKHLVKTDTCTRVSYLIAETLAKKGKPLADGELIKKCIIIAFNKYCPEKVNLVKETCLSHQTIGRRINDLVRILKAN